MRNGVAFLSAKYLSNAPGLGNGIGGGVDRFVERQGRRSQTEFESAAKRDEPNYNVRCPETKYRSSFPS
jgi:hypothetical protein